MANTDKFVLRNIHRKSSDRAKGIVDSVWRLPRYHKLLAVITKTIDRPYGRGLNVGDFLELWTDGNSIISKRVKGKPIYLNQEDWDSLDSSTQRVPQKSISSLVVHSDGKRQAIIDGYRDGCSKDPTPNEANDLENISTNWSFYQIGVQLGKKGVPLQMEIDYQNNFSGKLTREKIQGKIDTEFHKIFGASKHGSFHDVKEGDILGVPRDISGGLQVIAKVMHLGKPTEHGISLEILVLEGTDPSPSDGLIVGKKAPWYINDGDTVYIKSSSKTFSVEVPAHLVDVINNLVSTFYSQNPEESQNFAAKRKLLVEPSDFDKVLMFTLVESLIMSHKYSKLFNQIFDPSPTSDDYEGLVSYFKSARVRELMTALKAKVLSDIQAVMEYHDVKKKVPDWILVTALKAGAEGGNYAYNDVFDSSWVEDLESKGIDIRGDEFKHCRFLSNSIIRTKFPSFQ